MGTDNSQDFRSTITEAVKRGASSIHFSVGSLPAVRVDDQLVLLDEAAAVTQEFVDELIGLILSPDNLAKFKKEKEIVVSYELDSNLRFKVTVFYQKGSPSVTMRHIPVHVPLLKSLGVSQAVVDLAKLQKGMVIVSGPFGSGRSTTVAALLEEINRTRKEYVITIEDPIEFIFTNKKSIIEQREVGRDTNSFLEALRYFEEEDGDVLFLEELRDVKVIPEVLEIARGSSLVFTVVSAGTVVQTISRILDSFQASDLERIKRLLSTSLKAIVCQKLVPKFGGGLMAVFEVMLINDAVQSIIMSGNLKQLDNIIQTSRGEGMVSFDQSLAELARLEKISYKDTVENAVDKEKMNGLLNLK